MPAGLPDIDESKLHFPTRRRMSCKKRPTDTAVDLGQSYIDIAEYMRAQLETAADDSLLEDMMQELLQTT